MAPERERHNGEDRSPSGEGERESRREGDILALYQEMIDTRNARGAQVEERARDFIAMVEHDRKEGTVPPEADVLIEEMRQVTGEAQGILQKLNTFIQGIRSSLIELNQGRLYTIAREKLQKQEQDVVPFLMKHRILLTEADSLIFAENIFNTKQGPLLETFTPYVPFLAPQVLSKIFSTCLRDATIETLPEFLRLAPVFGVRRDTHLARSILGGGEGREFILTHIQEFHNLSPEFMQRLIPSLENLDLQELEVVIRNAEIFHITFTTEVVKNMIYDGRLGYLEGRLKLIIKYRDCFGELFAGGFKSMVNFVGCGTQEVRVLLQSAAQLGEVLDASFMERFIDEWGQQGAYVLVKNYDLFSEFPSKIWYRILKQASLPVARDAMDCIVDHHMSDIDAGEVQKILHTTYPEHVTMFDVTYKDFFGISLTLHYILEAIRGSDNSGIWEWYSIEPYLNEFEGLNESSIELLLEVLPAAAVLPGVLKHADCFHITFNQSYAEHLIERFSIVGSSAVLKSLDAITLPINNQLLSKLSLFHSPYEITSQVRNRRALLNGKGVVDYIIGLGEGSVRHVIDAHKVCNIVLDKEFALKALRLDPRCGAILMDALSEFTFSDKQEKFEVYDAFLALEDFVAPREKQLLWGAVWATAIQKQEFEYFDRYDTASEYSKERLSALLKDFCHNYRVGHKGATLLSLLAVSLYEENMDPKYLIIQMKERVAYYSSLFLRYDSMRIPDGFRASLGMEYEITPSVGTDYTNDFKTDLSKDIRGVSRHAGVGQGRDGLHELATQPTDHPLALLLELKLLQDIGFIDFNFRRYTKVGHGYHLTLGGEQGLNETSNIHVLQNALIMSGWGGVNAGAYTSGVTRGRHDPVRERGKSGSELVFKNQTPSVELRSLSIDAWEPFERSVLTAYFAGIAIQVYEKYLSCGIDECLGTIGKQTVLLSDQELLDVLLTAGMLKQEIEDGKVQHILLAWIRCAGELFSAIKYHNENFYNENYSPGAYQELRELNATLSDEEFFQKNLSINPHDLFHPLSAYPFVHHLTAINNLFLKPSRGRQRGDTVNALAMLQTTKVGAVLEESRLNVHDSLFDHKGKQRKGYYSVQNASQDMITHRVQQILLNFREKMEEILEQQEEGSMSQLLKQAA